MHSILAYADSSDPTQTNFILVLLSAGGIAGVCVLAGLLIVLSRRWRHRHAEQIIMENLRVLAAVGSVLI